MLFLKKRLIQYKAEETKEIQKLIRKNYYVTCFIKDDSDVYTIHYELKAENIGNMTFNSSFYVFPIDVKVKIKKFEIDGNAADYISNKYSIRFKVRLNNSEPNKEHKIFLKYEEIPLYKKDIMSSYRRKNYGISHRLGGQNAEFILVNKSNLEIISFSDEFFKNKGNDEYYWKGIVPEEGKETEIILSKKEAEVKFYEEYIIKATDESFIRNVHIKIPFCYKGGNNQEIEFKTKVKPEQEIKTYNNKKIYEVYFMNLKKTKVKFIIEGKIKNRCKGEWVIDLTNEEIETLIPPEYKTNKEEFKKISEDIIKKYNKEHKDDLINVSTVTKIGKWVQKNIIYDITYIGLNDITAMETFNIKRGVCHHKTKLFNALMYSLGYQVLYLMGFAVYNKKSFSKENLHC